MNKFTVVVNTENELNNYNEIKSITRYVVGNEDYAIRIDHSYDLEQIKEIVKVAHENKKEVFVLVNKIFHQKEIKKVEQYLKDISQLNIDGIIFSDLGVAEIVYDLKLPLTTIYHTETTITNQYFTTLAKQMGIDEVVISKDLTLNEIAEINENKDVPITVMFHGPIAMYYSPRELLKTYNDHLEEANNLKFSKKDKKLYLYDDERDVYYFVHESKTGTHLLSSDYLTGLKVAPELFALDVDNIYIDSFTFTEEEMLAIMKIYDEVNTYLEENKDVDRKKLKEYINGKLEELKATNPERIYNIGFFKKKTVY